MRQGELLGLHWPDIDMEQGKLHIRGNLRRTMEIAETKQKKNRRQISLTSLGIETLKRHRAHQAEERLAPGSAWTCPELVFTNAVGGYMDANKLRHRAFPKLLERAELPRIRFHDLRHSAATLSLSLGVHPKVVQELLGHSQISVTIDTYSHILPDM
jgi:integrase